MKKLINTVEVHEMRAKRALLLKQARKHESEAAEFRRLACEVGMKLHLMGEPIYKDHPIYVDQVLPVLREARKTCLHFGFDFIYTTRTPISGQPLLCHALAGAVTEFTPKMQQIFDIIKNDETLDGLTGLRIEAEQPQQQVSDNSEKQ